MDIDKIEKEWRNEPMRYTGYYRGYPYVILRSIFMGQLNGYVGIPAPKRVNRNTYINGIEPLIRCHWGINFRANGRRRFNKSKRMHHSRLYKKLKPVGNCNLLWIGFDCAHGGDITPFTVDFDFCKDLTKKMYGEDSLEVKAVVRRNKIIGHRLAELTINSDRYRNFDYVEANCKSIIDQLIEIKGLGI